jgi:hypothetical protein
MSSRGGGTCPSVTSSTNGTPADRQQHEDTAEREAPSNPPIEPKHERDGRFIALRRAGPAYAVEFATHALRLGIQGIELLTAGRITLPIPEPDLSYLRAVRRGEVELSHVRAAVADAERRLLELSVDASVPHQPDRAWVDDWLHRVHLEYWNNDDR